jgi:predicted NBD/HSP70 family sugar kinase
MKANLDPTLRTIPPLDSEFRPAVLENNRYIESIRKPSTVVIGLERENGLISRYETMLDCDFLTDAFRYVERILKFLLWARGGWKIHFGGPRVIGEQIQRCYSLSGERAFDVELMSRVYERPFEVALMRTEDVPGKKESGSALGGHLDGCRIGFDLGASDYKVAAVNDGVVVYNDEFPWNPKDYHDPLYHYGHLNHALKTAAQHLPRVDAIGGSTAGVVVDNKIMVASLFRGVPTDKFDDAKNIFLRLRREWGVPFEVANDGDVTALAGAMALSAGGILGIAMGSSEAGGFIDPHGCILGWLNELAFAPVDDNPAAPTDGWSGDRGVGALYFSQQAVNRLLASAGIDLPHEMDVPERLKRVQELMAQDDPRAGKIYETIGVYLGYTIPHYASFYDFRRVLILGRVTTGAGGNIILAKAREILHTEFPQLAERVGVHLPDEKHRRVGQAVAAASLPVITR